MSSTKSHIFISPWKELFLGFLIMFLVLGLTDLGMGSEMRWTRN